MQGKGGIKFSTLVLVLVSLPIPVHVGFFFKISRLHFRDTGAFPHACSSPSSLADKVTVTRLLEHSANLQEVNDLVSPEMSESQQTNYFLI